MKKYYIYSYFSLEDDYDCPDKVLKEIVSSGNGKYMDKDKWLVISEQNQIDVEGNIIESTSTLERNIEQYGETGNTLTIIDGLELELDDVANILLGELYQSHNGSEETYADVIYNAKYPTEQIKAFLNDFVDIQIDIILTDINEAMDKIRKLAEEKKIDW